jgi:hypothetical protein
MKGEKNSMHQEQWNVFQENIGYARPIGIEFGV